MDLSLKGFALTTPSLKGVPLFPITNSLKGMSISLIIINNYTLFFIFFLCCEIDKHLSSNQMQ